MQLHAEEDNQAVHIRIGESDLQRLLEQLSPLATSSAVTSTGLWVVAKLGNLAAERRAASVAGSSLVTFQPHFFAAIAHQAGCASRDGDDRRTITLGILWRSAHIGQVKQVFHVVSANHSRLMEHGTVNLVRAGERACMGGDEPSIPASDSPTFRMISGLPASRASMAHFLNPSPSRASSM